MFRPRKYKNIVEASCLSKILRIFSGTAVFIIVNAADRIECKFSFMGLVCFLFDFSVYFYCTYKAHVEDQTVVRLIYDTKMRRYGDDAERVCSVIFVLFSFWKIPFSLSASRHIFQQIVDIDKAIESMGEIIDFNKNALSALLITLCQFAEYSVRLICIWITLDSLGVGVPVEKMYQVIFTDAMSLMMISHYCFFVFVLRDRYRYLNKILTEIQERKAWEYKLFMRTKFTLNVDKAEQLQYRSVCMKINSCAKVYGQLYRATNTLNKLYGTGLVLILLIYIICIILYMFYFMEATAGGLFMDIKRYMDFLMCVFWQIAHAVCVIYAVVYFSESTVNEASKVAFVTHEIIQKNIHPDINTEPGVLNMYPTWRLSSPHILKMKALQLSLQIMHQTPKFTANGLVVLNNALLYEAVRSVFTYLIIVLQFVTEST